MKYGELLIEAKTSVNEALLNMSNAEMKNKAVSIMDCYTDAF